MAACSLEEVILEKSMNAFRMLDRIDATSSRISTMRTITLCVLAARCVHSYTSRVPTETIDTASAAAVVQ